MSIEDDIRFVAEKLGRGCRDIGKNGVFMDLCGGFFIPYNHPACVFAFIAYAKAELAKRGWHLFPRYLDVITQTPDLVRTYCVWPNFYSDMEYITGGPTFPATPTDPMSVATAELKAMREVLS